MDGWTLVFLDFKRLKKELLRCSNQAFHQHSAEVIEQCRQEFSCFERAVLVEHLKELGREFCFSKLLSPVSSYDKNIQQPISNVSIGPRCCFCVLFYPLIKNDALFP